MNRSEPSSTFDDLPDLALIQIRPLVNYGVLPYSATTIWRKCKQGEFPQPVKLSAGITAWRVGDIRNYLLAIGTPKTRGAA
jgi:predicted DNA-binding transcriptional regulator AlpA